MQFGARKLTRLKTVLHYSLLVKELTDCPHHTAEMLISKVHSRVSLSYCNELFTLLTDTCYTCCIISLNTYVAIWHLKKSLVYTAIFRFQGFAGEFKGQHH